MYNCMAMYVYVYVCIEIDIQDWGSCGQNVCKPCMSKNSYVSWKGKGPSCFRSYARQCTVGMYSYKPFKPREAEPRQPNKAD